MAGRDTQICNAGRSDAEHKLRRVVRLLARAEARNWLAGRATNDPATADGTSTTGTGTANTHSPEEVTHAD